MNSEAPNGATPQNPWRTLSSRYIYENPWIQLTEYHVVNPAGGHGIYGLLHYKNLAIGVIPVDEAGYTWLVGQYRYPLAQYSWEIPEGGGPHADAALASAQRELREETGLTATNWRELQRMHLSNSVSDELALIYLATDLRNGDASPEATEDLALWHLPLQEATELVHSGAITDSLTVAGLLRVEVMQLRGEL